jgi:alkylhydroperoxidase family enzyme
MKASGHKDAERVAIQFAIAAASQPNDVTDELFPRMKQHWSEGQIVEITSLIAHFGFWKLGKHASENAG